MDEQALKSDMIRVSQISCNSSDEYEPSSSEADDTGSSRHFIP